MKESSIKQVEEKNVTSLSASCVFPTSEFEVKNSIFCVVGLSQLFPLPKIIREFSYLSIKSQLPLVNDLGQDGILVGNGVFIIFVILE